MKQKFSVTPTFFSVITKKQKKLEIFRTKGRSMIWIGNWIGGQSYI